jgi:hypothetical protein
MKGPFGGNSPFGSSPIPSGLPGGGDQDPEPGPGSGPGQFGQKVGFMKLADNSVQQEVPESSDDEGQPAGQNPAIDETADDG